MTTSGSPAAPGAMVTLQIDWSVNAGGEMRAAAVQLESIVDIERNLETAERLVRRAAADGAELVVLPERLDIRGQPADHPAGAESLEGRAVSWARGLARELAIDLVAGSIAERREGRERVANTSVHAGPDGEIKAALPQDPPVRRGGRRGRVPRVGAPEPADEMVVSETAAGVGIGLSVCYDLRFPELYRSLARTRAPDPHRPGHLHARTPARRTGRSLLRARAIENQVFVIAPGRAIARARRATATATR